MKKTSYEISYDVITSMGNEKTNEDAYGILELPDKNTFLYVMGLEDTVMVKWRPLLL